MVSPRLLVNDMPWADSQSNTAFLSGLQCLGCIKPQPVVIGRHVMRCSNESCKLEVCCPIHAGYPQLWQWSWRPSAASQGVQQLPEETFPSP